MFNTGWKTRGVLLFLFLSFFSSSAFSIEYPYLKVYRMDTGQDLTRNMVSGERGYRLELNEHELVLLRFVATYKNKTASDFEAHMKTAWNSVQPNSIPYVEGWNDSIFSVPPGESTLEQIVMVHPMIDADDAEFTITAMLYGDGDFKARSYRVVILISDLNTVAYDPPEIVLDSQRFSFDSEETKYSPGLINTIQWSPGKTNLPNFSVDQSAYRFDVQDPTALHQSVRGLFKGLQAVEIQSSVFEGLQNDHTYGYFIKSIYTSPSKTLTLYSDIAYSTQDNTPPEDVSDIHADIDGDGKAVVWWRQVSDKQSGVSHYRIYRAVDTGVEALFDTLAAEAAIGDSLVIFDTTLDTTYSYYYTVHAVDVVGNEGYGDRSERISPGDGNEFLDPPEYPPGQGTTPDMDPRIIQGSIHTQSVVLNGLEKRIRFQSVRDDTSYFENPPDFGMRTFDSGWINPDSLPTDPAGEQQRTWTFDYAFSGEISNHPDGSLVYDSEGEFIDLNFVNGHIYYTRVLREYITTQDTMRNGEIIPDCYAPGDIQNLKGQALITDPAYTSWQIALQWNPADDDVSGLKRYHVYKRAVGLDGAFQECMIEESNFTSPSFVDTQFYQYRDHPLMVNPIIVYRVVSEDLAGNLRDVDNTDWEVRDRTLWPPIIEFTDTEQVIQAGSDTLYTQNNEVNFRLERFDLSDVEEIVVGINDVEQSVHLDGSGQFTLSLGGDETDYSIQVRAIYRGGRSSIWSTEKMVVKESNEPPTNLLVYTDTMGWEGNILLKWDRPSLDAVSYQIWRWDGITDSSLIGTTASMDSVVRWVDYYGIDELTGNAGDTLTAYKNYGYRIRKQSIFGNMTDFSSYNDTYCNRPPLITFHQIKTTDGRDIISIDWKRTEPTIASGWWQTRIRVSEDSLSNVIFETDSSNDVVDDTTFTIINDPAGEYPVEVEPGHNYIFEIRETPQFPQGKLSGWSQPYTVSLVSLDSLFLQPQPRGNIFLSWEEDILVDYLPVHTFEIYRMSPSDTIGWILSKTVTSYTDSEENLTQGVAYAYRVTALNDLEQVLATNTKHTVCDKGAAFIPDATTSNVQYFNDDSITVFWSWRDENGYLLENTTEGARLLRIETSASNTFPDDPALTVATEWFPAHPTEKSRRVLVPETVNSENESVYYRMSARDRWGQPVGPVWSSEFYGTQAVVFDPLAPYAVQDLQIIASSALYSAVDTIVVSLHWTEHGVRWPADENTYWSRLVGNISEYRIELENETGLSSRRCVPTGSNVFTVLDTVNNSQNRWRIVAIDSAGNETSGEWVNPPFRIETPQSPLPTGFRSCVIQPIQTDTTLQYLVEVAMDPDHFHLAYEMDAEAAERLLCRSEWLNTEQFTCTTGWGNIVTDSTWFRVKARSTPSWESGWSPLIAFSGTAQGGPGMEWGWNGDGLPETFQIHQNTPNPFNAETRIAYDLPESGHVTIRIYNILGAMVRRLLDEPSEAGYHAKIWNGCDDYGRDVATGIYLLHVVIRTQAGEVIQKKLKMMTIQ